MKGSGTEVHVVAADLASSQGVRDASAAILGTWSEIDALVNNAGVARFMPFDKTNEDALNLHLNLNVKAPFLLTQALFVALKARQGSVINVSSYFARRMLPARPSSAYSLSKGAIESFTKELAFEAGPHGVRVNAIAPGTVRTPLMLSNLASMPEQERTRLMGMVKTIYPLGRLGAPEDIAGAARFLASRRGTLDHRGYSGRGRWLDNELNNRLRSSPFFLDPQPHRSSRKPLASFKSSAPKPSVNQS